MDNLRNYLQEHPHHEDVFAHVLDPQFGDFTLEVYFRSEVLNAQNEIAEAEAYLIAEDLLHGDEPNNVAQANAAQDFLQANAAQAVPNDLGIQALGLLASMSSKVTELSGVNLTQFNCSQLTQADAEIVLNVLTQVATNMPLVEERSQANAAALNDERDIIESTFLG